MMNTMRINISIFWVAAMAMISVSCAKEIVEAEEKNTLPQHAPDAYSFAIAAGNEEATRAVLDQGDYTYYWETGDQVGLIIVPAGSASPIDPANPVIKMTNDHVGQIDHTTFSGQLTQTQLDAVSSENVYDYYTYFPYELGSVGTLPNVQFAIPSTLFLTPNVFNPNYAPMAAQVETNQPPVVYLDGQEFIHGSLIHFDYKHTMSYAAIEMDVRLMPQTVTSLTITNNSGTMICGTYNYNMSDGSGEYISGGNSVTVNITGGLTAGDGSVLYVPMPPMDMTGQNFTLTFQSGSSANKYKNVATVSGINFEKGKIHRLRAAPAATFIETTSFTVTRDGYYYIEAWGGNGGSGQGGASGGTSQKVSGLYQFIAGETISVYVGKAGENATGTGNGGTQPAGGTNGSANAFGNGGAGGHAGSVGSGNPGGKGGGGGAGTFIFKDGTSLPSNLLLVSGGGGGGGGKNYAAISHSPGGGGSGNNNGSNGSDSYAGRGGATSGAGGASGSESGTAAAAGGNGGSNGGAGGKGDNATLLYSSGGGGGGGGGGYYTSSGVSGGGGGGGVATTGGGGGGGGGAGGGNYGGNTTTHPSKPLPNTTSRPSGWTDGYVVITFIR